MINMMIIAFSLGISNIDVIPVNDEIVVTEECFNKIQLRLENNDEYDVKLNIPNDLFPLDTFDNTCCVERLYFILYDSNNDVLQPTYNFCHSTSINLTFDIKNGSEMLINFQLPIETYRLSNGTYFIKIVYRDISMTKLSAYDILNDESLSVIKLKVQYID